MAYSNTFKCSFISAYNSLISGLDFQVLSIKFPGMSTLANAENKLRSAKVHIRSLTADIP